MKKIFYLLFGLAICASFVTAQSLDEAILAAAVKISRDLPAGATVAIIRFNTDSQTRSNYVITELNGALLRTRRITPVNQDQNPQYHITGSLELFNSDQRIRFTAVDTESGETASEYSAYLNLSGTDDTGHSTPALAWLPQQKERQERTSEDYAAMFNSIGLALGTSFMVDPMFIVTIHGTFAPVRNVYIEIGCDMGFTSVYKSNTNNLNEYYSIYPFANIGYFRPFNRRANLYAGAGAGYMFGKYTFGYGEADVRVFVVNFTAGLYLGKFLNISGTLRTDFDSVSFKLAVGYAYRFKNGENNAKN